MTPFARSTAVLLGAASLFAGSLLAADYYPLRGIVDPEGRLEALAGLSVENLTSEQLTTTGWLFHLYRNDNRKARELLEKALEAQPQNPWARYGLCLIQEIGGDFDEVLSNSLALIERSPSHPLALLALLNVRALFGQISPFNRRAEKVLGPILSEGRSRSVQFDEICREILSAIGRSRGDAEALRRLTEQSHYVAEWRVVGPFGEFPNLAFLSRWQPESDRVLRPRYKVGDRLLRPRKYTSREGPLRPHWASPGLYYAETFLRSSRDRDVILKVSSPSAIELFLNNNCIYSKDTVRSHQPLTQYVRARLDCGYNRILVKCLLETWDISPSVSWKSLGLKCSALDSMTAPSLQVFRYPYGPAAISVSASPHEWRRVQRVEHSNYAPPTVEFFSGLLGENPDDPLLLGLSGILRSVDGDVQVAKRFLRAAVRRLPSYSYFNYALGVVVKDDPSLPAQIARSEARAMFRSAKAGATKFPLAVFELALLDIEEEKHSEAIATINQCIADSPVFFPFHERLYTLYRDKKWRSEQQRQLDAILALGLESCSPYHLGEEFYRSTTQYDKLPAVIEKLQSTHVHPRFLAQYYSARGEDSRAIAEYSKIKAALPYSQDVRRSLVKLYERNGRWLDAARELRKALTVFPQALFFWKELAGVDGRRVRSWGERLLWGQVLRQDPADLDARKALKLFGLRDILDEYDIPSSPYIHDDAIRKKYAGVSSVFIIDQVVEEIYPNCSSRAKTHQLILLNDRKAIDTWGELDVPGEELLELRTIKRDGTVVEPERPAGGKTTISMGGLQEGDFIEFKYITTTRRDPSRLPRYLGQRFFFQSVELPMELSQYVVIVPDKMELTYEQLSSPRPPSVTRRAGKKVYKWEAKDVPAVPREPLAAPDVEFLPFVRVGVSYDQGLEFLQYQNHNIEMTKITDEIREAAAKILADSPPDIDGRARAIYSFVNKEVQGGGGSAFLGRSASETLADKAGDRLSLTKAMLEAAGIESRMLIVREELSHASKVFPGSFTSGLLALQDATGRYTRFLDFSSRYLPFGYVNCGLQGGTAVPLQDFSSSDFGLSQTERKLSRGSFAIPRFPSEENCERTAVDASVGADGSIQGEETRQYNGDRGASLRTGLLGAEAYQIREFIERFANLSYRAAALTHHKVENLSDPEKPLLIEYGFRAPNFARVAGKEMRIDQPLLPLRLGSTIASLEVRRTPLQISRELNVSFQALLRLPSGADIASTPPPLQLEGDFGSYLLQFAEVDDSIHVERVLRLKAQRISPEAYSRFVDFCRAIDAAERKEIIVLLER